MPSHFSTFEEFIRYMNMSNDDECLETRVVRYNSNDDLIKMISSKYTVINLSKLPLNEKKESIRDICRREYQYTAIKQDIRYGKDKH